MNGSTTIRTEQVRVIEDEQDRAVIRLHGVRYKGDRYVQPLHHHSFLMNHKAHTRDKIKRS